MSKVHFYFIFVVGLSGLGPSPDACGPIQSSGLQLTEAFIWYLKKHGLSNSDISTGGIVFDSCSDKQLIIQKVVSFESSQINCYLRDSSIIQPSRVFTYIGADNSLDTVALSQALDRTNKTLMSSLLTTNPSVAYRYFLPSIPGNTKVDDTLIDLLKSNNVRYFLLVHENNNIWEERSKEFSEKAKKEKICTVDSDPLPDVKAGDPAFDKTVSELVKKLSVTYLVVLAESQATLKIMQAINRNANAKNNLIVITFGFLEFEPPAGIKYLTLVPSLPSGDILTATDQFFSDYKKMFTNKTKSPWLEEYCIKQQCNNLAIDLDQRIPFLFLTLSASMKAVEGCGGSLCTSDKISRPQNVFMFTKDVQLSIDGTKQRVFDKNGFINPTIIKFRLKINNQKSYLDYMKGKDLDILKNKNSCPNDPCIECGQLPTTTTVKTTTMTLPATTTPGPAARDMITIPKVDSLTGVFGPILERPKSEYGVRDAKWIIPLGVLASLGVLAVIIFEITILYKLLGTQLGHQWRTMWLGQLLLFGVLLCFLTLFAYLPKPTDVTCGITRFGVGFSYAVVFSVMLVKLMVILTSKASDGLLLNDTESPNYLRGTYQILMFIFSVGVQLVIDIQWLLTVPPRAVPVTDFTGNQVWICNHYTWSTAAGAMSMENFIRNEFENHLLTLVYIMFLILVTTVVSMKAHGIITNHRESVFIGISSGLSIPLWIAWTLIAGLNRTSDYAHQYGDACIAFGLFLTGALVLFAMFLPKVRQMVNMGLEGVYLEDDRDTNFNGSVIMPPSSYKSGYRGPASVVYVNGGTVYSESIKDPLALHLKHPGSTYSAPAYIKSNRPESLYGTSRVLKVTPELTGRILADRRRTQSEHNYPVGTLSRPRSEKGSSISRSRSTQDLGAL